MSKKINTIFCCCIADPWLQVVKKLNYELNIVPKYFIGWNDGSEQIKNDYESFFANNKKCMNNYRFLKPEL